MCCHSTGNEGATEYNQCRVVIQQKNTYTLRCNCLEWDSNYILGTGTGEKLGYLMSPYYRKCCIRKDSSRRHLIKVI
jgi:hypothetical protein